MILRLNLKMIIWWPFTLTNSNCVSVWKASDCQDAAHPSEENDSSTMEVYYKCETEIKMSLFNIELNAPAV